MRCTMHNDCFANKHSECICLSDTGFKQKDCPFYKTVEQSEFGYRAAETRLSDIGRLDLAEAYSGRVYMRGNEDYYPDPTFDTVFTKIRRESEKNNGDAWVYIASPLRGNIDGNIQRAKDYCRFAVKQNKLPFCPHIYFTQFLDDNVESERRIGMLYGIHMLKRCKELWVFGDRISEGMQSEIRIAKDRNMPIRYFGSDCKEAAAP